MSTGVKNKEWRERNAERLRAYGRAYNAAHPGYAKAKAAKFRRLHPERAKEIKRKSIEKLSKIKGLENYSLNVSVKNAENYIKFKEKYRATRERWRKANPEKTKRYFANRRSIQLGASIEDAAKITKWQLSWKAKRSVRCYWCNKAHSPSKCHTDHIKPISKGGPHCIENLCVSCANCNLRKNNRDTERWNAMIAEPALVLL